VLFRRNREISRLEAFSDAVFGFALTLLVVSVEVPHDYEARIFKRFDGSATLHLGSFANSHAKRADDDLYRATKAAMYFLYWACAAEFVYHVVLSPPKAFMYAAIPPKSSQLLTKLMMSLIPRFSADETT
jgi:hypothetical protein